MTPAERFQRLLRDLFKFDAADLDFGIYRILNLRRQVIDDFIEKRLVETIERRVEEGALGRSGQAAAALDEAREAVLASLGATAFDADGKLKEAYRHTPVGSRYVELQEQSAGASRSDYTRATVFNHLYTFFSRYYADGDFISKRRYSQLQKYVIPYNGEEVLLHWANADQYYVKSGATFTTYRFRTRSVEVVLAVRKAQIGRDNNRDDDLFLHPLPREITFNGDTSTLHIPFERRPLSEAEASKRRQKGTQEAILQAALEPIGKALYKLDQDGYLSLFAEHHKRSDGSAVTQLEHHLLRFADRNTSDFFVHTDLGGFLSRELDFYVQNEVLRTDELLQGLRPEDWGAIIEFAQTLRSAGQDIIDFLAQIEDFQRVLFEKRKLVVDTQYCIAVSQIPTAFLDDVVACDAQWVEWFSHFGFDADAERLRSSEDDEGRQARRAVLEQHPSLLVDTRHFTPEQVDRLLSSIDEVDSSVDALLIQGDNFQALNLLGRRYRRQVSAVYIDPPYNTSGSEILYKNSYKHSSWLTLMANRLRASRPLLADDAVQCTTIDDAESPFLHSLLERIFGRDNYLATAVIRSKPQGRAVPSGFSPNHEYGIFYAVSDEAEVGRLPRGERQLRRYRERDERGIFSWANFRKTGADSRRRDRPKSFYPVYVSDSGEIVVPDLQWNAETDSWDIPDVPAGEPVWPIDEDGDERVWTLGWVRAKRDAPTELEARRDDDGNWQLYRKYRPHQQGALPGTWWENAKYSASESGTKILNDILGSNAFSYPKSVYAVEDCLRACDAREDDVVLDFFAGSGTTGHAVINLNRDDGGRRHVVLIEMGDYFDDVLLPRLKKVAFSPAWRDGRPVRPASPAEASASPRILKYLRIESYDDVLNNVQLQPAGDELYLHDDYLLRYFLDFESRDTPVRLGGDALSRPFQLAMGTGTGSGGSMVRPDLPETFSLLMGLRVVRRLAPRDRGRRYVVHVGTLDEQTVVVIWRDIDGWGQPEFVRDKEFIESLECIPAGADVYTNGDSLLANGQSLNGLFRDLMFGGV